MSRLCQECGYLLDDTATVCPECGSKNSITVKNAQVNNYQNIKQPFTPPVQSNNGKKKSSFPWLIIIIAAVVLLFGVVGSIGYLKFYKPHAGLQAVVQPAVTADVAPAVSDVAPATSEAVQSDNNNVATENGSEINQSFSAITKAFFYDQPDETTARKAYLAAGDVAVITKIQNGFGYTVFTNANGQVTEGWVKMSELQIKNLTDSASNSNNEPASSISATDIEHKEVVEEPEKLQIFSHVEVMPQFPGGDAALIKWLADNIQYPAIAKEQGTQGRVSLRFVVKPDGTIDDVQIVKGLDTSCDNEAVRVVKMMPKWIPGKQNGNPVYVYYSLPITFRLQN